jgi:phospholipase C
MRFSQRWQHTGVLVMAVASRSQANACDQSHEYLAQQQAFNAGLMDTFVEFTGVGSTTFCPSTPGPLNFISRQTHEAIDGGTGDIRQDVVDGSVIGAPQPLFGDCSTRPPMVRSGRPSVLGATSSLPGCSARR